MKSEKDRLKEIFAANLGEWRNAPDFEFMWQKAAERNRKKRVFIWSLAASVALIVAVGALTMLTLRNKQKDSVTQITSWSEPTRTLVPSQRGGQLTALTHWTSPTRFLLPGNDQPIK